MTAEEEKPSESDKRQRLAQQATESLLKFPENSIKQVILFGSTARGEARPDSDIDVCITFDNSLSNRHILFLGAELTDHLRKNGFKTGVHVPMYLDLSLLSDRYFEEGEGIPEILKGRIEAMKEEGIVLYPKVETPEDNPSA